MIQGLFSDLGFGFVFVLQAPFDVENNEQNAQLFQKLWRSPSRGLKMPQDHKILECHVTVRFVV